MNLKTKVQTKHIFLLVLFVMFMVLVYNSTRMEKIVAKGFAWEVTKEDKTISLVGTIDETYNIQMLLSDQVVERIEKADVLSVEVNFMNDINLQKIVKDRYLDKGDTIENHLSREEVEKLVSILKPICNESFTINEMKKYNAPQLGALVNNMYSINKPTRPGVDNLLMKVALKNKVQISELKVNELKDLGGRIEMNKKFYTWDDLRRAINDFSKKECNSDDENIEKAYVNGDIEACEKMANTFKMKNPEGYKMLLMDRNMGMANKIDALAMDGRNHVVAVGTLHFMGEESILKLLEQKGYTITRIN